MDGPIGKLRKLLCKIIEACRALAPILGFLASVFKLFG